MFQTAERVGACSAVSQAKRKKVAGVPSVVPLSLPGKSKLKTGNLLLQLEDPDFDLSGDTGAVGRYNASRKKVELDMKGVTYAGSMVKCHTLCTVLVTDGKAEVKEVFGNFVHLAKTADVRDKEEMEGADFDDFDDFEISGDESVDEAGSTKGGRKKGAKGRKSATKNTAAKVPLLSPPSALQLPVAKCACADSDPQGQRRRRPRKLRIRSRDKPGCRPQLRNLLCIKLRWDTDSLTAERSLAPIISFPHSLRPCRRGKLPGDSSALRRPDATRRAFRVLCSLKQVLPGDDPNHAVVVI